MGALRNARRVLRVATEQCDVDMALSADALLQLCSREKQQKRCGMMRSVRDE